MNNKELVAWIRKYENRFPMTGKPDPDAAYKNGWYDCAYQMRQDLSEKDTTICDKLIGYISKKTPIRIKPPKNKKLYWQIEIETFPTKKVKK